jgi:hypothetical protein
VTGQAKQRTDFRGFHHKNPQNNPENRHSSFYEKIPGISHLENHHKKSELKTDF